MSRTQLLDRPWFLALMGALLFFILGLPFWRGLADGITGAAFIAIISFLALCYDNPFARLGRDED